MTREEFLKRRQRSNETSGSSASQQQESLRGTVTAANGKQAARGWGKEQFLSMRQSGNRPWAAAYEKEQQEAYASLLPGYERKETAPKVESFAGSGGKIDGGSAWRYSTGVTDEKGLYTDFVTMDRKQYEELRAYEQLLAELQTEKDAAKASGLSSEEWYARMKEETRLASEANARAQREKRNATVGLSAGASAGEFAYMFEDEQDAASKRYGAASEEAESAYEAFLQAKHRQELAELFRWDDVRNRDDFADTVKRGEVNERNKVNIAEREKENIRSGLYNSDTNVLIRDDYDPYFDIDAESLTAYTYMNEDERQVYSYLLAARGEQAADEYLEDIRETLNARQGYATAERIEQQGKGLRLVSELALAGGSGLTNAIEGLGQNFRSDALKTSATQYASQYTRQNIEGHGYGHRLEGIYYDAMNTMANMAPSLAVGALNPIAGAVTMGFQSKGNAYKQALDAGYTKGQAELYSWATGAAEAGLSYVLGGFEKLGGISQFTGKMTAKIGKAGLRAAAEIGLDIVGENAEEYLQNKLEPLLKNTIFGENNEIRLWDDEDTYTLILTTLTTGLMNGAEKGINAAVTRNQIRAVGKSWMQQGLDAELIEKAAGMNDPKLQPLVEKLQEERHKPSARELGELAIAYEEAGGDMSFVIEHALKTDEKATEAIREANGQNDVPGNESTGGTEIERAAAVHGKDAKLIEDMYQQGQDADEYARAMDAGINLLAAEGTNREALDKSSLTAYLTEQQKNAAWEAGHAKYEARQQRAAEFSRKGSEQELSEIRRGTVSWEGATIDGVQYAAVDRSKLSSQQTQQTDACSEFAEKMGIDLAFFDGGESDTKGAYRQGGKIFLNVNNTGSMGEALIVSAFSHEVTHFAEEYGGSAYEELRSYVVQTLAENDQAKFEQLVEDKRKARGGISYEEALSEVVADGCETMLRDTKAPEILARENPTLLQKICDWLGDWVKKIKAAFRGVEARHAEAKALLQNAEQLQARFDKALAEAVQNRETVRGENETTAEDGGRVQYSKEEQEEILHLQDQIRAHEDELNAMDPVAMIEVPNSIDPFDLKKMIKWAINILKPFRVVDTKLIGKVELDADQIDNSFNYLPSPKSKKRKENTRRAVIAAYPAIPKVLKQGIEIERHVKHKGNDHDTVTIAAPVMLNNERGNMGVVVKLTKGNRYKVHRILTPGGDLLTLTREEAGRQPAGRTSEEIPVTPRKLPASDIKISQNDSDVKVQKSERDNSASDRDLLREAAEHEGASEELKKYARKADNLEAYQRRLERQEKKLAEMKKDTSSGPAGHLPLEGKAELAALEKRVDETKALIARTQTALTRMELRPSMQQEIQEARESWWNANMGDAVQTAREIQKENRELKEAVDYYREQAKLTGPENRRVDPADVKRFARALLKEHSSSANVDDVSAALQKLGDKLVRGDSGSLDYFDLKKQADKAAKLIIDEVYKDANADVAEIRNDIARRVREVRLQISDELRGDIPDFNAWRKAHLGKMTLVNEGGVGIDSFYKTLGEEYGKGWFPKSKTSHSEQIERIEQILDGMKPKYVYAYTEMQHGENVALVSQEIMDTILSGEIREAETIADRNYRKMQERMLTARKAQRDAERRANAAERRADRAEETALRKAREEQREIMQDKIFLLRQELNEGREAQQKRINIERMRGRLSRLIRENSKTKHIAEPLRGAIGEFLLKLDTLGPFSEGTKSEAKFRQEMQELENALRGVMENADFYGNLDLSEGVKTMLQNNIGIVNLEISGTEETVTRKMKLPQLQALEETLTVLSTAVKNVNELLSDGEHRFHQIDVMAESMINGQSKLKDKALRLAGTEKVSDFFEYDNTTPYYFFKRLGPEGEEIYWRLAKGNGKVAQLEERVVQDVKKIYKDNGVTSKEIKEWKEHENAIRLVPANELQESTVLSGEMNPRAGEREVFITDAQAMNVYLLSKREQGRSHLYGAGIKLETYRKGIFERPQESWYTLMPEDVAKITGMLSEQQIKTADEMGKYIDSLGKELGNEISMKLYGVRWYNEENYWPITTDSDSRGAKAEGAEEVNLYRTANPGFSKKTVRNASNAVRIGSVFDVFAKHSADLINYNAMALPLLDAKRFLDFQGNGTSVQQSIRRAYGGAAVNYYTQLLKDLNGGADAPRGEGLFSKTMSNVKVSSVGANLRVMLQQPTSIVRATMKDVSIVDILAGMGTKGGLEEALKYSDIAKWKHNGHYDTNISRSIAEKIKGDQTLKSKIQEATLKGAEWGDALTLGSLWNACKIETRRKTGLSGQELIDATVRRYEDVLLSTQVIDGTLMRSQNMRSKSAMMKEFTAFKAEPTLTYNIILDLKSEFDKELRTNGLKAATNKMYKPVIKTGFVWAMTNVCLAAAQAIGDAGRDDDDYETWMQKFTQHWIEDFKDDMNPLSLVPMLDDLITIALDKDKDLLSLQGVKETREFVKASLEWYRLKVGKQDKATAATNYGRMTDYGLAYKGLKAISDWSGVPISAGSREVRAGYNTIRTIWNQCVGTNSDKTLPAWRTYDPGPEREIKNAYEHGYLDDEEAKKLLISEGVAKDETEAGKTIYGWSIAGASAYKAVKEAAVKGDAKAYQEAMKAMTDAGYTEKDVQTEVKKEIKQQYLQPESGPELSKAYCVRYLVQFAGMDQADAEELAQEWTCYKVTGIAYDDLKEAYVGGDITAARAKQLWMTYGGEDEQSADRTITNWTCERETGIAYGDMKEAFLDGRIDEKQAVNMRVTYGGVDQTKATQTVREWACEKESGFKPEDLDNAYLAGELDRKQAKQLLQKYRFMDSNSAELELNKMDFRKKVPEATSISDEAVKNFMDYAKPAGISEADYFKYWSVAKNKTQAEVVACIDSLNITDEQKDVLYLLKFTEKNLKKTPWHK